MKTNNFYFVCLTVLQMAGDYPDRNWFCLLPLYQTHNINSPQPPNSEWNCENRPPANTNRANNVLAVKLIPSTIILWLDPVFKWIFHQSIMIHGNEMRPRFKIKMFPRSRSVFVTQDSVLYLLNCPHNVSLEGALIMTQNYT